MSFAPAQRVHTYSTYERFYCRSALRLWNCNSCFWPTTLMCIASEHRSNLCQLMGLICDWSERSSALQPVISPHCREQKHVDYKEMASLILLATKQRTFWKEKFGRFRSHAIFIKINDFYNVRWEQKKVMCMWFVRRTWRQQQNAPFFCFGVISFRGNGRSLTFSKTPERERNENNRLVTLATLYGFPLNLSAAQFLSNLLILN